MPAYTDATATSGVGYTYEVEAANGTFVSPASNTVTLTTPLSTPARYFNFVALR